MITTSTIFSLKINRLVVYLIIQTKQVFGKAGKYQIEARKVRKQNKSNLNNYQKKKNPNNYQRSLLQKSLSPDGFMGIFYQMFHE